MQYFFSVLISSDLAVLEYLKLMYVLEKWTQNIFPEIWHHGHRQDATLPISSMKLFHKELLETYSETGL